MWTIPRQQCDRMLTSFRWPLVSFAIAGVAVLIGACDRGSPAARATLTLPPTIRLLSWNLHRCEAGVARMEAELISHSPDVVFLQEAEVAGDMAAAHELAPRLAQALGGFHVVSARTLGLPPEQHCDVAILSRWPIRSVAAHSLEPGGWVYAVEGVISTDAGDLALMSVHTHATWRLTDIAHVRESTAARRRQIDGLVARSRDLLNPAVIGGDFNAPAGTQESQALLAQLHDLAKRGSVAATVPAKHPLLRLDYILSNRSGAALDYRVVDSLLSDHRPVLAIIDRSQILRKL